MKLTDWLSERMVFGLLLIGGYLGVLATFMHSATTGKPLDPETIAVASGGMGTLGTAIGTIVAAIWRVDKTDKTNAQTVSTLANAVQTAMTLPPSAEPPQPPTVTMVQP